jgi:phosphate:Na+ symporter
VELELLFKMIFQAVGGLGIFLLGMKYMSEGIQTLASNQLRRLISLVTNNRLIAVSVGTLFTCLVQSSSVTTVMIVGLTNSGVMTLLQGLGVMMGANIGTTITGWILVIKIGKYGLPVLGIAAFFHLFSKNERLRFIAMTIMGIGMIFFGLELMKNGFKPLRSSPEFITWFSMFDAGTYFGIIKLAFIGCLVTLIVQSSSATLAITMGLAATGVINFESAAALVLGENIGTTITAHLAALGARTNAKRLAYAHVIFNILGVTWMITVFPIYMSLIKWFLGLDPGLMVMENGSETYPYIILGIAAVHTGFNVTNTALFLPFIGYMESLLQKMVPDKPTKEIHHLTRLDSGLVETPGIALEHSHAEILKMGKIAKDMMNHLKNATGDDTVDDFHVKKIFHKEEALDVIQNEIFIFLTDLLASEISHEIADEGRQQLRMADEYESISDYIAKILKLHLRLRNENLRLPEKEKEDISHLHDAVDAYMELVNSGFANRYKEILIKALPQSDAITHRVRRIRTQYIERLSDTRTEPAITMIFADMLNDYRRVKDHTLNIAEAIAGEK